MTGWTVEHLDGVASVLHARLPPDRLSRSVWVCSTSSPAIVLGSTQPLDVVDRHRATELGFEVVKRASGGGAVVVEPGMVTWIDVLVPVDDPLWVDDVGRSAQWLGEAWSAALHDVGVVGTTVHNGSMCHTKLSRLICFAGLAPGEVSVGDAKVVGISQRRTRTGARFQSVALRAWDVELWAELLAPGLSAHAGGLDELQRIDVAVVDVEPATLTEALIDRLP